MTLKPLRGCSPFFLFLYLTCWEEEQHLVVIDSDICFVPCYRLRQWRKGGSNTRQRHNKWGSGSGTDSREDVISPPAHFTVQHSVEPREASARTSPPFCSSACSQTLESTGISRNKCSEFLGFYKTETMLRLCVKLNSELFLLHNRLADRSS